MYPKIGATVLSRFSACLRLVRAASSLMLLGALPAEALDIGTGFNGDGTYVPPVDGLELIDNPFDARKLWESGPPMGFQKTNTTEPGTFYGGVASVIVEDGIVFANYIRPSGTVLNEVTENRYYRIETQREMDDILRLIDADDVTVAFDAETGATLWTAEELGRSMNFLPAKRGHYGVTPAYGGGAVYVWGALGIVYVYDAQSGAKLWETPIEPLHSTISSMKATSIAQKRIRETSSKSLMGPLYNFRTSLLYLEGVVVAPTEGSIVGLDAQTGVELWRTSGRTKESTPSIPVIDGKAYLLISDSGTTPGIVSTVRLVDPVDGSVVWSYASGAADYASLIVQGDLALISKGEG